VSTQMVRLGNLLPPSELRRLSTGSYEQRIERVSEALDSHLGGKSFTLIATHPSEVVALVEGTVFRFALEEDRFGSLRFVAARSVPVETLAVSESRDRWLQESREIVFLVFEGREDMVAGRLRSLVSRVRSMPRDKDLVEAVHQHLRAPRFWREVVKAQGSGTLLSESVESPVEDRLRLTFRALYDGSSAVEAGQYADRINEELGWVMERSDELMQAVRASVVSVQGELSRAKAGEPQLVKFEDFATDLIDDLRSLCEMGLQAGFATGDVRERARLHDVLVEGLRERSAACRFVAVVADRLIS
jgi:hypothetical protein